jgi:hypothetical protein
MPIIERPGQSPHLSQGDILEGVRLFVTQGGWEEDGISVRCKSKLCMVLSRPCSLHHKRNIVVAAIDKYLNSAPQDAKSFREVRQFLTDMRDGVGSPDLFYLGQIPSKQGRFAARLDSLHTIGIPDEADDVEQFIGAYRVGSLNEDFRRDLHLRLFTAFASLGFQDEQWLSEDDLAWLIKSGENETAADRLALSGAEMAAAKSKAEGKSLKKEQRDSLTRLGEKIDNLESELQPYRDELARRSPSEE